MTDRTHSIFAEIENVEILPGNWRNFKGEKRQYNAEGSRNFSIGLTEEQAAVLLNAGWPVKSRERKLDEDEGGIVTQWFMKIKVNFGYKPPMIYQITNGGKVMIGEGLVGTLDHLIFTSGDVQITGRPHDMNGGGYTPYLNKAFLVLQEDALDLKWAHIPTASSVDNPENHTDADDMGATPTF